MFAAYKYEDLKSLVRRFELIQSGDKNIAGKSLHSLDLRWQGLFCYVSVRAVIGRLCLVKIIFLENTIYRRNLSKKYATLSMCLKQ